VSPKFGFAAGERSAWGFAISGQLALSGDAMADNSWQCSWNEYVEQNRAQIGDMPISRP
jgi:hypothetical protein